MSITTILFDADGVIQTTPETFIPQLKSLINEKDKADQFLNDIFTVEYPFLKSGNNFDKDLSIVLKKWNVKTPLNQVLKIWELVNPVTEIIAEIRNLQEYGIKCYLATNQQYHRAKYMRSVLNYDKLFDGSYYSYQMDSVKPEELFFQKILSGLSIHPSKILFIDDKLNNIIAARKCGIQAFQFNVNFMENPGEKLHEELSKFDISYNNLKTSVQKC
ncbi:MAG: HAD-IA family hydrolase [Deltaproteobacteria bacterium]|nr:HAD-IA family hydrolase [Deltaproteobacteria bacterium]